jgi:uncharacterized protein Usg
LNAAVVDILFTSSSRFQSAQEIKRMGQGDFAAQLKGFSLTTAEILYRMPDHPSLLQSYIWQEYDLHPLFPKLKGVLNFWSENLEGALYRIRVTHKALIHPREYDFVASEFRLH